jgi:hypothetical protein
LLFNLEEKHKILLIVLSADDDRKKASSNGDTFGLEGAAYDFLLLGYASTSPFTEMLPFLQVFVIHIKFQMS